MRLYHRSDADAEPYGEHFELIEIQEVPADESEYCLWLDGSGFRLMCGRAGKGVRLTLRDLDQRSGQALTLAKACGADGHPRVADVMAGWGVDGLSLARRGCPVTLIERSPVAWAMLDEFVSRLDLGVEVVHGDASEWLASADTDVVYLDPMFAARTKTALPSKRLQVLQDLAWRDATPLDEWLDRARDVASQRVVLKRRAKDPVIGAPDWQVKGRQVRFDVYRGCG